MVTLSHTGGLRQTSCNATINQYTSWYTRKSHPDQTHYPHISIHYLGQQSEHSPPEAFGNINHICNFPLIYLWDQLEPPAIPSNPASGFLDSGGAKPTWKDWWQDSRLSNTVLAADERLSPSLRTQFLRLNEIDPCQVRRAWSSGPLPPSLD